MNKQVSFAIHNFGFYGSLCSNPNEFALEYVVTETVRCDSWGECYVSSACCDSRCWICKEEIMQASV
jgi:hypothetical protein